MEEFKDTPNLYMQTLHVRSSSDNGQQTETLGQEAAISGKE